MSLAHSVCPICQTPAPDDFGLVECTGCGAQLIVSMDGEVQHATDAISAQAPRQEALGFSPEEIAFATEPERTPLDQLDPTEMIATGEAPAETFESEVEFPDLNTAPDEYEMAPAEDVVPEAEPEPESEPELPPFDGSDDFNTEPPANVYGSSSSSSPDLSDVAQFGNSDMSGGRDGSLRYNLFIEGIDTTDVRAAFREALTDRKLMWDTDQILRSLRNGKVSIPNVPPTKAYILISRLRGMPVQVRWEQYALSQT